MPETTAPSMLERAGEMPAGYRHIGKRFRSSQTLLVGGACLKWYDVAPEDTPVEEPVQALARDHIVAEWRAGRLAIDGEIGFVVLHRCGAGFYFLQVCTWRNHNEVWETVYAKDGVASPEFVSWPADGPHRPTFCVWELGPVIHEQAAWSRYLRSRRDLAARRAYMLDVADDVV
jgi:hypothetical protein